MKENERSCRIDESCFKFHLATYVLECEVMAMIILQTSNEALFVTFNRWVVGEFPYGLVIYQERSMKRTVLYFKF